MGDKQFITITEDGISKDYEILLAYKWTYTSKYYIVYTDNTKDEEDNLNVYASIYYPNDDTKLDPIETEEEWDEVDNRLKELWNRGN
jgi:uncharacterized protein YrzB (UPF0473 family)